MKNKFLFLSVVLSMLLLSGCEKPNQEQKQEQEEYYGKFQKACVRLKVQDKTADERKAQVVGDSAAVWKVVRWGTNLHQYNMIYDINSENGGINLTNWSRCDRDTVDCVYIFGYECVVVYGDREPDENGIWHGVPGSEKWGFLMQCENMVIAGKYDETNKIYYDPYWGFPGENPDFPVDTDTTFWDFRNWHYDTLGYIPNSIVRANRERLIPLFNEGKYSEMIKIMENDYVIYTCTGAEYRELARQGLN